MDTPPENFDALKKLLALKRHEQPPPGYFENFSSKVCARIEAAPKLSWWQQLLASFEVKPAMVGFYGVAVCAALLMGVHYAGRIRAQQTADPALSTSPMLTGGQSQADATLVNSSNLAGTSVVQTNPAPLAPPPFMFNTPSGRTERVNFPLDN